MKHSAVAIASAFATSLWFGTEDSYDAVLNAMAQARELEAKGPEALKTAIQMRGGGMGGDPYGLPPLWHVMENGTAVVDIAGSLVNGSAGFYRLFGIVGYEDIKGAIAEALDAKDVKRIVLNIDSGGGAVNGVEDAGSFIRKAASVKPVLTFTGGTMGSAAYWLGSSADHVFAAQTAQVGSVGTLIIAMERSEQMKKDGITAKVFRYGKYKALANSYEKLTADGEEQLQNLADESGKIFVEYAAGRRGTTPEKFQKTMGEGRVFMGRQAAEVGLVDGIMSFDEFAMHAKTLDKRKATAENSRHSAQGTQMKIRAISKAVTLAILGGTKIEALGLSAPVANVEGIAPEAEDVTALTAEAAEVQAAFEAATAKAVLEAKAVSDKALSDLNAKVALLEAGAADLSGRVTASNEMAASYSGVVKASIATMAVALGGTDTGATLQGAALLAEHDRLKELFVKKFPGGQVSATTGSTTGRDETTVQAPPAAFLAATARFAKN
jgi:signal peptide peptidase SppA